MITYKEYEINGDFNLQITRSINIDNSKCEPSSTNRCASKEMVDVTDNL